MPALFFFYLATIPSCAYLILDYLKPSMQAAIVFLQCPLGLMDLNVSILFVMGLLFDVLVYVWLTFGIGWLRQTDKHTLNYRFWMYVVRPTVVTCALSGLSFWFMLVPDYNAINELTLNVGPAIILTLSIYFGYDNVYKQRAVGPNFAVLQALFMVLSDIPCAAGAVNGWPVSILLLITVNMLATYVAYMLAKLGLGSRSVNVNWRFLKLANKVLAIFRISRVDQKLHLQYKHGRAMFSVLLSSKLFVWTCGAFFGPNKCFGNSDSAVVTLIILSLLCLFTGLRLLYYASLICAYDKQRLTLPWEPLITLQLSPAWHVWRLLHSSFVYCKLKGYGKLLRFLRVHSQTADSYVDLVALRKWILLRKKSKPLDYSLSARLRDHVLSSLIERGLNIYALVRLLINPLILMGKSWVTSQAYYSNLQYSVDVCSNIMPDSVTSGLRKHLGLAWDQLFTVAALAGITGLTVSNILNEWVYRQDALELSHKAPPLLEQILKTEGTNNPKVTGSEIQSATMLAGLYFENPTLRNENISKASSATLDLAMTTGYFDTPEFRARIQMARGQGCLGALEALNAVLADPNVKPQIGK